MPEQARVATRPAGATTSPTHTADAAPTRQPAVPVVPVAWAGPSYGAGGHGGAGGPARSVVWVVPVVPVAWAGPSYGAGGHGGAGGPARSVVWVDTAVSGVRPGCWAWAGTVVPADTARRVWPAQPVRTCPRTVRPVGSAATPAMAGPGAGVAGWPVPAGPAGTAVSAGPVGPAGAAILW